MTEEERHRRLAEMAGNAEVHEEARWARQKHARDADTAEQQANAPAAAGALPFFPVSTCGDPADAAAHALRGP